MLIDAYTLMQQCAVLAIANTKTHPHIPAKLALVEVYVISS